jgi:signal transduction histidine kinase
MSYSEGLLQGIPKNESLRKEYYDIIRDEADRMNRLVKDLLDLSGYESGTFTIEKSPFVVNDLIDETVERFTYTMADKAITIVFKERENPFTLLADRLRVGQILSNLLSNAFKHVNEGGTIRISLESVSEKTKMTISNTGALIPEAALEDIWHSFYQVDTESEGNGLGLAIVKSIVQLHQGSCRAYTTEAENCFEIML